MNLKFQNMIRSDLSTTKKKKMKEKIIINHLNECPNALLSGTTKPPSRSSDPPPIDRSSSTFSPWTFLSSSSGSVPQSITTDHHKNAPKTPPKHVDRKGERGEECSILPGTITVMATRALELQNYQGERRRRRRRRGLQHAKKMEFERERDAAMRSEWTVPTIYIALKCNYGSPPGRGFPKIPLWSFPYYEAT